MFLQQRHAAEGARADTTLVLLHLGVGLQMSAQVGAICKGPVAVGAGEWTLTWTRKTKRLRHMLTYDLPGPSFRCGYCLFAGDANDCPHTVTTVRVTQFTIAFHYHLTHSVDK